MDAGFGGQVASHLEALAGRIRGLEAEDFAQETARKFWSTRSPALGGLLVDIVDLDRIDDETTIMRRPRTVARLEARAQHVMLVLGDRELRLPVRIQPALAFVLETPRFRVGELVPYLDPSSRLVLARRLVAEGLVLPDRG